MNLGRQWRQRLQMWSEELQKYFYTPLLDVEFEGFTTFEHLSFENARKQKRIPMSSGTSWGDKWEYGWFFTRVQICDDLIGQPVVMRIGVGPEMLVWINGEVASAIDGQHKTLILTDCAKAGEVFEIAAEAYAGHGPRLENGGPYPMTVTPVPEVTAHQVCIQCSTVGIWHEAIYQAWIDYEVLYQILQSLPEHALRAMKIEKGLKAFTYKADFELDPVAREASIIEARACLTALLTCVNGSTTPTMSVFGQSHLDLAWLWPVEETKRKSARTYANQLRLMERYEEYQFLLCEPPILEYLKQYYPEVYSRVKAKVEEGRFIPEGGLWVEGDCNLPSGETLIRQFLWGKQWFQSEYGVETKMAWMPDTFGFSAALPQIMKGCDIPYFATQKLLRADPETEPFPYNLFWWEGIDGSKVLSHLYKKNNARLEPKLLIERWEKDRNQTEDIDSMLFPFGFGDGGGGPTRDMLEMYRRLKDLEGAPKCVMESPIHFFERIAESDVQNIYTGELYLAWHRGTYTSQAAMKMGLRKAEVALREAEFWASIYLMENGNLEDGTKEKLHELWSLLLFNTFHDILPGTSIRRVHEEAENDFKRVIEESKALLHDLLRKRCKGKEPVQMLYNALSFERTYEGHVIPACGQIEMPKAAMSAYLDEEMCVTAVEAGFYLENNAILALIDHTGRVISLKDKKEGKPQEGEWLSAPGNDFIMYKDVNGVYDAWELEIMAKEMPVKLSEKAEIKVIRREGCVGVSVERQLNNSLLSQEILLKRGARRLEFQTTIDWKERHKLLKVAFPANLYAQEAICDIQFGYIKRPLHKSRQFEKDHYEVWHHKYCVIADNSHGLALLNDGKYGLSFERHTIQLTLLKAPVIPDMEADLGTHHFVYALYPYRGTFDASDVIQEGYDLNYPLVVAEGLSTQGGQSYFEGLADHIVVEALKPSETFENAIVARLYEAKGKQARTFLKVPPQIKSAEQVNLVERPVASLEMSQNRIPLEFRPFEIKTILLKMK
ncbi:glycoside hydrolase family 38 C-terminal domain-containing protein [Fusibacter sp. 3D3]|uniref:alpha-mannosidase n=1 Tax=Fusibacter sp. 3D3 TaxID=1048380 RepID=UPI0008537E3B|nr:glycoside hydrolase family 38 C-terminal domain-containing protein [Fusibacter sp. 3D3]GAU76664.1 alpha-mannosidase [Fusibacter sp. 3D3]